MAPIASKDYIDAKADATRALNDARFAEILAELRVIREKSISRWEMWLAVVALAGVMIGALSYGASQFGIGASVSPLIASLQEKQAQTDAAQDAKLDLIIQSLDGISKKIEGAGGLK